VVKGEGNNLPHHVSVQESCFCELPDGRSVQGHSDFRQEKNQEIRAKFSDQGRPGNFQRKRKWI